MKGTLALGFGLIVMMLLAACTPAAAPTAASTAAPKAAPAAATQGTATQGAATPAAKATAPAAPAKIKRGGTLRVGILANPTSLDPMLSTAGRDGAYLYPLYDTVVGNGEDFKPNQDLGLAESWQIVDPTTIVLKLRKGVKFQDGTDVNAKAIKYNLDRVTSKESVTSHKSFVLTIKATEVVDDYTLKLNLQRPSASILVALGDFVAAVASPAAVEKYGKDFSRNPVGSGPFKLKEWVKDDHVTLVRNENYWRNGQDGKPFPYLDQITFVVQPDATVQLMNVRTGELDAMVDLLPKDLDTIKGSKDVVLDSKPSVNYHEIRINTTTEPLKDVHCRRALLYGINYDAINKTVYMGTAAPWQGFISPPTWAFDPTLKLVEYSPAKAKDELKACGKPDGFSFTYQVRNWPDFELWASVVQQNLKDIGIDMSIEVMETAKLLANLNAGEFQASSGNRPGQPDPDMDMAQHLCSRGFKPPSGLCDAELDKMADAADAEYDFGKRKELYKKVNERFVLNVTYTGIGYLAATAAYRPYVKGFINWPNLVMKGLEGVWLDK